MVDKRRRLLGADGRRRKDSPYFGSGWRRNVCFDRSGRFRNRRKRDVIPIFDDEGYNTATIFDDLNLFNVEFDELTRPQGAGQGFVERPWSWDGQRVNGELGNYRFIDDKPIYGPPTKGEVVTVVGASSSSDLPIVPSFAPPSLNDALGDRIQEIMVRSNGLYSTSRTVDLNRSYLPVKIDFDGSHRPDLDQNGSPDFYSASALAQVTFSLSKFTLDENGTFLDVAGSDEDVDASDDNRYRSLYAEEPSVFLLPALGAVDFTDQNASSHFRLNGLVDYSPAPGKGHFDLYVDDRFPNSLYYGFSSNEVPAFGGKITVTDGLPGMNWAVSGNDPVIRNTYAFTDQNGYYAVSDLDAGLYNVAVFMEDKNSQEITFRPDTNQSLVSRFLYLPGFPDLILQSDDFGWSKSLDLESRCQRTELSGWQFVGERRIRSGAKNHRGDRVWLFRGLHPRAYYFARFLEHEFRKPECER